MSPTPDVEIVQSPIAASFTVVGLVLKRQPNHSIKSNLFEVHASHQAFNSHGLDF